MQVYNKISFQPLPIKATVETLRARASEFEKFYVVHGLNIYVR